MRKLLKSKLQAAAVVTAVACFALTGCEETAEIGEGLAPVTTVSTADLPTVTSAPVTEAEGGTVADEVSETLVSQVDQGYYADTYGLTGEALKAMLNDIISEDHGALSYDQVYSALEDTDEDPEDPSKVLLFYKDVGVPDNYQRSSDDGDIWNREHVWAKSHGEFGTAKGPGTDLHMIRATDASVNARRGHLDFDYSDEVFKEAPDTYVDEDSFEPRDEVKGDVARMLFYMAVRYEGEDGEVDLELSDRTDTYYRSAPGYGEHGKLSTLLEWHELDPVDDLEQFRNDRIEEVQGNRNPFIDYPEFVAMIWGDSEENPELATQTETEADSTEIEMVGIDTAREMNDGRQASIAGTVVYVESGTTLYLQDIYGGIRIDSYGSSVDLSKYSEGLKLQVHGEVDTYKGEKELLIDSRDAIANLGESEEILPVTVMVIDISDGLMQGQLIRIADVEIAEVTGKSLLIEDREGYRMTVYFGSTEGFEPDSVRVGDVCDVTGIASWYNEPQIKLIQLNDD